MFLTWNSSKLADDNCQWFDQFVERRAAVWEVESCLGSVGPNRTNTHDHGLKITEENVLPLL